MRIRLCRIRDCGKCYDWLMTSFIWVFICIYAILYLHRNACMKGLVCGIDVVVGLVDQLLESGIQRYLLMYKFSQDHLELFFNAIRGCGK